LREALARSDHDFVLTAPSRPRGAAKRSNQKSAFAQLGAAALRRPGRTLVAVVFTGMLCGVVANALFMQTARHPAPIFRGPVIARPAHVSPPAPIPVPPQRPAEKILAPQSQPSTALTPASTGPSRFETSSKDQIGALLSGGSNSSSSANNDGARVVAAQKALVKLGYVVKPDGVMGAGTRKALEMFEQSRKLPLTGDLSPRVTRELSALSGIAVP
jgi:hypothetical protein